MDFINGEQSDNGERLTFFSQSGTTYLVAKSTIPATTAVIYHFDPFSFTYFQLLNVSGGLVEHDECSNTQWSCNSTTNQDGSYGSCHALNFEGNVAGTCGLIANICQPDIPLNNGSNTKVEKCNGGVCYSTGAYVGSGTVGGGAILNPLAESNTGACNLMFSGSTFLYASSNSSIDVKADQSFDVLGDPWSCKVSFGFGSFDICGVGWSIWATSRLLFQGFLKSTTDTFLQPFKKAISYAGVPIPGHSYCFFGEVWTYQAKPTTYHSNLTNSSVSITGRTGLDFFFLFGTTIAMFSSFFF